MADSQLGPVVRELWPVGYAGHDSREILLDFIYAGPISDCADLALEAALDTKIGPRHQTYGGWGVVNGGSDEQKQRLADALLGGHFSERFKKELLPLLVPQPISIDQAFTVIESIPNEPHTDEGLDDVVYRISKNKAFTRADQITLRRKLTDAIWQARRNDSFMSHAISFKDHYRDGLIATCAATIPETSENAEDWACAVTIATHFAGRKVSTVAKKETIEVQTALNEKPRLREHFFWACVEISGKLEAYEIRRSRFLNAIIEFERIVQIGTSDLEWLLASISQEAPKSRREMAFEAVRNFFDLNTDGELKNKILRLISDKPSWCKCLNCSINPQPIEHGKYQVEMQALKEKRKQEEADRIEEWIQWRKRVLSDPEFFLTGDERQNTLERVHWLTGKSVGDHKPQGRRNSDLVAKIFSPAFLERYRKELCAFWRDNDILLPSERDVSKHNQGCQNWGIALAGVKAEAEVDGWASRLTDDEVIRASRLACLKLDESNGFYVELDEVHSQAIANVISTECMDQLRLLQETGHANLIHGVYYHGTENIKSALANRITPLLASTRLGCIPGAQEALKYAVLIVASHGSSEDQGTIVNALQRGFKDSEGWPSGFIIALIASLNPEAGCRRFLQETSNLTDSQERENAIVLLAEAFDDRLCWDMKNLSAVSAERRVPLLKDLLIRAYQIVPPDEDISHEGLHSPGPRENAQAARSRLLDHLLDVGTEEVLSVLDQLASRTEFSHMPDRLRQMAYEVAGKISDASAFSIARFQKLDREGAFVPYDSGSLLRAMMARLDEFEHDLLYAEDSTIEILRKVDDETELRRFISHWLRRGDNGVFQFTQEAVVQGEKRTDLRFHPNSMPGYATVELKLETWSISKLENALSNQLVGQYLQHQNCQVGCLLICQRKPKLWRNPNGGPKWSLNDVVKHLQASAKNIMSENKSLHLEVKGINCS